MIYILVTILTISVAYNILLSVKFSQNNKGIKKTKQELIKKRKEVNEVFNLKLRKGYYTKRFRSYGDKYDVFVFVTELDRFTNGKSRIKFDYINLGEHPASANVYINGVHQCERDVKKKFVDVIETSSVVWLESVSAVKKERAKKLKRINDLEI